MFALCAFIVVVLLLFAVLGFGVAGKAMVENLEPMPFFMTDDLKADLNRLAREFYAAHGYEVAEGFDFSVSSHPQERLMFALAEKAYEFFEENEIL